MPARRRRNDPVDRVVAILQGRVRGKDAAHKPLLYWWMRDHYDRLSAAKGRPDWKLAAAEFAALGLKDHAGNLPSPETARKTWFRVRRDMAALAKAEAAKSREPPLSPAATSSPAPPSQLQPMPPPSPPAAPAAPDEPADRPRFKTAIVKGKVQ